MAWRSDSRSSWVPERNPRRPRTYFPNFGFSPRDSTRAAASSSDHRSNVYEPGAIRPTVSPGRRTRGLTTGIAVAAGGSGLFGVFFAKAARAPPAAARAPIRSGPRLGYADLTEASVWVQTTAPAEVRLRYWPEGKRGEARTSGALSASEKSD